MGRDVSALRMEIEDFIGDFVRNYSKKKHLQTEFGAPLVGFADAKSEYFSNIKNITNENHALPQDILPSANLIISYYIPFTESLAKTNDNKEACTDKENNIEYSSKQWALAYVELNALMADMNKELSSFVQSKGYEAALPLKATVFDKDILMSYWSQRHIAYAAGLGNFGMNNMLISQRGCCGRYNSIVTAIPSSLISPDKPLDEEVCLYKRNGSCGVCMKRCPIKALSPNPENKVAPIFNRKACFEYCMKNAKRYDGADVCGKCVTAAACAFIGLRIVDGL